MSNYRMGDDCVWPHCSDIAKCPACKKDEEIERLTTENRTLKNLGKSRLDRIESLQARLEELERD